jgi:hypothetical protein
MRGCNNILILELALACTAWELLAGCGTVVGNGNSTTRREKRTEAAPATSNDQGDVNVSQDEEEAPAASEASGMKSELSYLRDYFLNVFAPGCNGPFAGAIARDRISFRIETGASELKPANDLVFELVRKDGHWISFVRNEEEDFSDVEVELRFPRIEYTPVQKQVTYIASSGAEPVDFKFQCSTVVTSQGHVLDWKDGTFSESSVEIRPSEYPSAKDPRYQLSWIFDTDQEGRNSIYQIDLKMDDQLIRWISLEPAID